MPLYEKFMAELLSFPSSRNDDMVDAFSFALSKRSDILRVANRHRRPKRQHMLRAGETMLECRISSFGNNSSGVRDRYFERTGRSVFDR